MKELVIGIVVGAFSVVAVGALGGYLAITQGWLPARGDVVPDKFESWAAHHALKAVLNREATDKCPLAVDPANLQAGVKVYAANCSGCHGAPANPTPAFAKGFNPGPTLFGNGDDVTDDPEAQIYWKVNHGIKFTGMPSFKTMLSEKEMWQVTLFLKNQNSLPADVKTVWQAMK